MYNLKYPREVCNPRRHVVVNEQQMLEFINANIASSDLFTNVYNFTEFKQPFMYPKYESAVIDRIYIDCDQKVKENGEWVMLPAYENMLKIHEWCVERDIIHFPRLTGSGYDVIILTDVGKQIKNKKACIADAQLWLCNELGIKSDPQVIGDISRIHRIDNTFNHKPHARRFCIPLDRDIIYMGEKEIFNIAKKQRFESNWYGNKYWDISQFDSPESKYKNLMPLPEVDIDESQFSDLSSNIPDCIKILLAKKDLDWKERRHVIICLRDNQYLLDETVAILRKHLSKKKFIHCVRDEKQPRYLYNNDKYMFSLQEELIDIGACPLERGQYCDKAQFGCLLYNREEKS